ncbi:probable plastid-lipid-associated protein 13, chloroplastic [Mangifera indica]|uniref:probable plastid-lipid-associated protein 13, chloroplastic n=1 Tax=Mangifera indica TaxID=29780 RepID=UPI001CFB60CB|nr:probable plastid-lipid-associated protein 13, chloroplastic [Mangifera indica]
MAFPLHCSLPATPIIHSKFSSSSSYTSITFTPLFVTPIRSLYNDRKLRPEFRCTAMVQQAVQGPPAAYAKEVERRSAKESLLLAFKDSGGFKALVTGKTTSMQQIDVNERITSLERLNPTLRPTMSPFLEGQWNIEWFGSGSPVVVAARAIFERFPSTVADLSKMDILINNGNGKVTANLKLLNSIESKIMFSSKLSVEGPLRMKEEYIEGIFESPRVIEEALPEQLKGVFNQAVNTVRQLPESIRDVVDSGLRVPLSGSFQRLFMISYLDEEILIIRDSAGIPEVLTRLDAPTSPLADPITTEYKS